MHRTKRVWYSMSGGTRRTRYLAMLRRYCRSQNGWRGCRRTVGGAPRRQLSRIGLAVIGLSLGFSAGQLTAALLELLLWHTHTHCTVAATATYQQPSIAAAYCAASWRRRRGVPAALVAAAARRWRRRTYQSINVFTAPLPTSHPKKEELEMVFFAGERSQTSLNTMYNHERKYSRK